MSYTIFELYTLKSRIDELFRHKDEICSKAKISERDFLKAVREMELFVNIIEDEKVSSFAEEGKTLAPHEEDAPLFAMALYFGCPVWSNETAFKKQSGVKVFSTKDIFELLGFLGRNEP